jgi:hypothetical protein
MPATKRLTARNLPVKKAERIPPSYRTFAAVVSQEYYCQNFSTGTAVRVANLVGSCTLGNRQGGP